MLPDTQVPREMLEIGDLVECSFYGLLGEGVIENISDGSEKGMPGELMYYVRNENLLAPLWLHRWEIYRKIDPEAAFGEAAHFNWIRRMLRISWNTQVVKTLIKRTGKGNFKGML